MVAAGIALSWYVAESVVQQNARDEALNWAEYIERNLTDLDAIIAGDTINEHDKSVLTLARDAGNVFRYHIFDPTGRIMFSSDFFDSEASWETMAGAHQKRLDKTLADGNVLILLADGRGKINRPDAYAEAYVPLQKGGRLQGVIEIYVDMTSKVDQYWQTMGMAIAALAGLLVIAGTLPGAYIWRQYERIRAAERHIQELAYRDPLTGLANRRAFQGDLAIAIRQAAKDGMNRALLMLDLDHFKSINDTIGHHAGDELLKVTAVRIREKLREGDIFARLGGDEFAVILPVGDSSARIAHFAENIQRVLAEPIHVDQNEISTSISIGVVLFPEYGTDPDQLLKYADIALYRAKDAGRATYSFFEPAMQTQIESRRSLETELRTALAGDQFEMHFQPLADLRDGTFVGAEALLRWRHPRRGLLVAGAFLPNIEDNDLITAISMAATKLSFKAIAEFRTLGFRDFNISINLSGSQLCQPGFVNNIKQMLAEFSLSAEQITLEITETVVLGNDQDLVSIVLKDLRALGFNLSLDDFGTGFASLTHLKRLPISQVKIDRSFVNDIAVNQEDDAIVRGILALCQSMDLEVVAEGIENDVQRDIISKLGGHIGQGYFLGKPLPKDEVLNKLINDRVDESNVLNFSSASS